MYFGPQGHGGGKTTLTAALTAVVVVALRYRAPDSHSPAVPAIGEPVAEPHRSGRESSASKLGAKNRQAR